MPITTLDYPGARIEIEVSNPIEATYRALACQKEPWTVSFIEGMAPDATFWDVGANVGPYTLIAAKRGHPAVAIEPAFGNLYHLCVNLAANALLDRVLVIPAALGAATGWDWLHYGDLRPGAASHQMGGERKITHHKQQVAVWALDDLMACVPLPGPRYLKVDVDGGEGGVLEGARAFLADGETRGVLIECRLDLEKEIVALLGAAGLRQMGRYDERNGKRIGEIAYGLFERA